MGKNNNIDVLGVEIRVTKINDNDYICITDMIKSKDGDFFVSDWLRNRNTVEFLSIWEELNNPNFNYGKCAIIKTNVGLNNYKISVKQWEIDQLKKIDKKICKVLEIKK